MSAPRTLQRRITIAYLVLAFSACLIFAVIALEAWPVSRLFWSRFAAEPVGTGEGAAIAISFTTVAALTVTTWAVARRSALKSLAHLRV